MRSIMRQAFVRFEPRDGGDAALRLVQKVGRRAERAAHRAVVERDQPHRADLGEMRLARRLARQRADPVGALEALPVGCSRASSRTGVLKIASRSSSRLERPLRQSTGSCRRRCVRPFRRCRRAAARHAGASTSSSSGRSPSPSTTRSNGPSSNISSGRKVASMPPATINARGATRRTMCASSRSKRSVMPGGRDADDVPAAAEQLALERALRRLGAAVRIEDLRRRRRPTRARPRGATHRAAERERCIRRSADRTDRSTESLATASDGLCSLRQTDPLLD